MTRWLGEVRAIWFGPLHDLFRAALAWPLLAVTGSSLFLTGQLDWGPGVYGERAVFAAALGLSSCGLWWLGARSWAERTACGATLVLSATALALFIDTDRLQFNALIWLIHLGLCWQLVAWARQARKTPAKGLWIMAGGLAFEALVFIPVAQFTDPAAVCLTGSRLACVYDSYVAVALIGLITVLLVMLWLNPVAAAFRGRAGRP